MKKMKIGLITHNFPVSENDRQNAGIFVYDLARNLNKLAEVVVFSPGRVDGIKNTGGIKTYYFKSVIKLGSLNLLNPASILKLLVFFAKGVKSLNNFINQNPKLDFIISFWAFPGGFFAERIFKTKKIPYAIYCLGSDIYIYAKKPLLKALITRYLKNAGILIADSPDLAAETKKLAGKEVLFLPSSSSFKSVKRRNQLSRNKITLTFLGRLEKVKGVDIFIDSLKLLGRDKDYFKVNIIGSGSLDSAIRKETVEEKGIKLWGNLDDQIKIAEILRGSDWLVIPSRSDSIPLVFSEAMKLSLPVICSDLPDLKYLVGKYNVGKTFKKNSSVGLSKVLKLIADKKTDYSLYKKNTKEAAEFFDLKNSSVKLMDLLDKHLS